MGTNVKQFAIMLEDGRVIQIVINAPNSAREDSEDDYEEDRQQMLDDYD